MKQINDVRANIPKKIISIIKIISKCKAGDVDKEKMCLKRGSLSIMFL